jgi:hypothetical protein
MSLNLNPKRSTALRRELLCIAAGLALSGASAHAADAVTDALTSAYAPYRVALFRTNSGAQAESVAAVAQARQALSAVVDRYGKAVPPPYDRDAGFASTLASVDAVYARAQAQIGEGRLEAAHETLEQVRDLLSALRQRSGVSTFSDPMNAYHAVMETVLDKGPGLLSSPEGVAQLTLEVGALSHLAGQLRAQASEALRQQAGFEDALRAVEQTVGELREAALRRDADAMRAAIGQLKKPYSQFFLKFG